MSAHAYTEDQLVEQPAIGLFAELGWTTVSALEETFGAPSPGRAATLSPPMGEGASLGRETKGEVVLVSRLRAALGRLNPALPPEAITTAVDELSKLWRGPDGRAEGYGLKCFPEKNEKPPGSPTSPSPNG